MNQTATATYRMNRVCPARQRGTSSFRGAGSLAVLALLIPITVMAEDPAMVGPGSSASLAFARYIASIQERNPFTESGLVAVRIEASIPGLYKRARVLAIRQVGDSERSEYRLLAAEGDSIVAQELIAPYLRAQSQLEELPVSAVAVTPANYRFRYKGAVGREGASAQAYQITPKTKRKGLIQGQLWIDSGSGAAILQTGRFVQAPFPFSGKVEVVCNTELSEGIPSVRITHWAIETSRAGRAELTITEIPIRSGQEQGLDVAPVVQE
jgi:hypothetical protein